MDFDDNSIRLPIIAKKVGGSLTVLIPKEVREYLNISENDGGHLKAGYVRNKKCVLIEFYEGSEP